MADNTFFLELSVGEYNTAVFRFAFATKDAALKQLALLEPLLGHGKYRNDHTNARHRIVSDDGEAVIVTEHVQLARVIDSAAFDALATYANAQVDAANARMAQVIANSVIIAQRTLGVPVAENPYRGPYDVPDARA